MTAKNPRIGVIGLGRFGRAVAERLLRLDALGAVCDLDATRCAAFATATRHGDALALMAAPDVDAVVLATPVTTRAAMARATLEAGKDLWAPPPLCLAVAELEALVALASRARRVLMIDAGDGPARRAMAQAIDAGELGALQIVEVRRAGFGPFRPDEPVAARLLPDLATLAGLLGEAPQRLRAESASVVQAEVPDHVTAHVHFGGGVRAVLTASRVHPTPEDRFVVIGDAGMLVLEGAHLTRHTHSIAWREGQPAAVPGGAEALHIADGLDAAVERFLAAVSGGETAQPDAADALRALRIFESIGRSLDRDRAVPTEPAPTEAPAIVGAGASDVFVHPTAVVDGPVEIGAGTKVWHFSKLLGPLHIGERCSLGQNVVIERHVRIGDNVKIQNNVSVYSGVILEDDVFCGPSMVFTNVGTPRSHYPRKGEYAVTRVERGASIGANATVVCGHTLGRYCFVGAGAVVTKDVPPYALVYGNPARVRGWTCFCGLSLSLGVDACGEEEAECEGCGRRYARAGHAVRPLDEDAT